MILRDANNNTVETDKYDSVEAAQAALDSLKNCYDCYNCQNCSDCAGCHGCADCSRQYNYSDGMLAGEVRRLKRIEAAAKSYVEANTPTTVTPFDEWNELVCSVRGLAPSPTESEMLGRKRAKPARKAAK